MATLVRWEPFRELATLQNEMTRLLGMGEVGNGRSTNGPWIPALDVWETEDAVVYAFDLPGIAEDQISVELEEGALTVTAERERKAETNDDRFYRFERRHGSFSRTVTVPQGVNEDDVKASYENGVLQITVPKPEQPKPRRIQVGSSAKGDIEGTAEHKA
jgi:HSP20 family protein